MVKGNQVVIIGASGFIARNLRKYLSSKNIRVVICTDLSASRVQKYQNGGVEIAKTNMIKNGVEFETWQETSL